MHREGNSTAMPLLFPNSAAAWSALVEAAQPITPLHPTPPPHPSRRVCRLSPERHSIIGGVRRRPTAEVELIMRRSLANTCRPL